MEIFCHPDAWVADIRLGSDMLGVNSNRLKNNPFYLSNDVTDLF